ncbi:MAG: ABC transporter [Nitrosomonadales bacterium SCN 54-20]|nr:MAG: ABC transporter [Nitrosomonadales bacterium SCN 54-20]
MHLKRKKLRLRGTQSATFLIALILLVAVPGYLAWENRVQWDVTQNERNSLSPTSLEVLKQMEGPLLGSVYISPQDAQLGNVSKIIRDFLTPYQDAKPDFTVTFIDPSEHPELAQEAGVEGSGEMIVEYNGRMERLTTFNEHTLINLLMRLMRTGSRPVVTLSGHGERRLDGIGNRDLGEFGQQLTAKGFRIQPLNLVTTPEVPTNTSLLVIASPQADLSEGEVDRILAYIERGGNLLWLLDQQPLHGLQPLAEKLELTLTPGVVIDPQAGQLKAPVTFSVGTTYGEHPITRNFDYLTVFPFARQITINENDTWHSVSLVEAGENGWVETGDLKVGIAFDAMYDVSGPVSIAAVLSRTVNDQEQRVAVIGSGYFLANAYLGYGRNLDFGVNLVNWLAGDEDLIAIQPRTTIDNSLTLKEPTLTIIAWGFLIVMPLIFLGSGMMIWWRRKRR